MGFGVGGDFGFVVNDVVLVRGIGIDDFFEELRDEGSREREN